MNTIVGLCNIHFDAFYIQMHFVQKKGKVMKKTCFLTSLFAISISCAAQAATDVTFAGNYTKEDGSTIASVSDPLADTTYSYEASDGSTVSDVAYGTDPDMTKFTYTDKDGGTADFSNGIPEQSDFTGTSVAAGDVTTTQEIVAGAVMDRNNYSYVNGNGETVALGETAQNMVTEQTLSEYAGGATITTTNGTANIGGEDVTSLDGGMYTAALSTGTQYKLSPDGSQLLNMDGAIQEPDPDSELETLFANLKGAYDADKAIFDANITETADKWATEQTNFDAANAVFETDSNTVQDLDNKYATVGTAAELLANAQANQQNAAKQQVAEEALYNAAKDTYDAPILETIENGANSAINESLAEGGAISDAIATETDRATAAEEALDDKITANSNAISANSDAITAEKDRATATENALSDKITANSNAISANSDAITAEKDRATSAENALSDRITANADAISANSDAITAEKDRATSAENALSDRITANADAIVTETDRATAAEEKLDGKIATNTAAIAQEITDRIAGDELTLGAAKAYTDAQNELTLRAANEYTDNRVNTLEKELSAGIASAAAMSSVAVSGVSKGEVSVGGGYGYYNSQSAVALGAAMGLTDNWSINAAAALSDSNVSFRAGTNYKFKLF